jgi:hypothetical protein
MIKNDPRPVLLMGAVSTYQCNAVAPVIVAQQAAAVMLSAACMAAFLELILTGEDCELVELSVRLKKETIDMLAASLRESARATPLARAGLAPNRVVAVKDLGDGTAILTIGDSDGRAR